MCINATRCKFIYLSHVAWFFSFDCSDVAEVLTNLNKVNTDFNDVDDLIDIVINVIGSKLSILSKKLSVMEVSKAWSSSS
jgi:hypothetical protein